jgi:hypothetical protein
MLRTPATSDKKVLLSIWVNLGRLEFLVAGMTAGLAALHWQNAFAL